MSDFRTAGARRWWIDLLLIRERASLDWLGYQMNSTQIASLVEVGIPLVIALLILAAPSLFIKKKHMDEAGYLKAKKFLVKCGVLLLVAAALLFVANIRQIFSPNKPSVEEFLAAIVAQNNQILPRQVDEFTTLERVSASDNTFIFHYKLQNVDVSQLSAEASSNALKPALIKQLGALKIVGELRTRGIHVHHVYSGANGSTVFAIKIAPNEY